jgi:hypothetical protein
LGIDIKGRSRVCKEVDTTYETGCSNDTDGKRSENNMKNA